MLSESDLDKRMNRLFNRAISEFNLISEGDRILVGLSGGKDSLTLLTFLAHRKLCLQENFEIIAAHIKFSNLPYEVDLEYLSQFCNDRQIEMHIIEDQIRDAHMKNDTCIHCSRFRRAKLMEISRVFKCNKLALGHHLDDVVGTLIMNMSQHGRFAGMAVKLNINVGEMKYPLIIIRPLSLISEDDIRAFIDENQYKSEKCRCPWGDQGFRSKIREVLDILSTQDERVRINLFRAQFSIKQKNVGEEEIFDIEDVGEMATNNHAK